MDMILVVLHSNIKQEPTTRWYSAGDKLVNTADIPPLQRVDCLGKQNPVITLPQRARHKEEGTRTQNIKVNSCENSHVPGTKCFVPQIAT